MRKRYRRRALSMTSLVDVIFLLLLFFMLSSTFSRFAEVELTSATQGASGTRVREAQFMRLAQEELTLNGTPLSLDALAETLSDGPVFVSLGADVTAQRLIDLMGVLRAVPDIAVTVLQ